MASPDGSTGVFAQTTVPQLQRRIAVALGQQPGDLLLTGGQVVNVFTARIEPADVVVVDGWIAGVGKYNWSARQVIDLHGQTVLPGLIDSHMHLESTLLLPAELARLIVPHGTTTTISDSHEVGNVLGLAGIERLVALSQALPFDLLFSASSCVPAVDWDHSGAVLGPAEVAQLLDMPRVAALAEMMNIPGVLRGQTAVLQKIVTALQRGYPVDGHAPSLVGQALQGYLAAGIRSDHESATVAEAREKARAGMLIQVREGSVARNLDALLPLLCHGELGDNWTLVTDDILPTELQQVGHIDALLRRVIAAGVPPAQAIRQATLIPTRHYHLYDRGAVAPGYRADLVVVADVEQVHPILVFKNGQKVSEQGNYMGPTLALAGRPENTVHVAPLDASAFQLRLSQATVPVMRLHSGQLVTTLEHRAVNQTQGCWTWQPDTDVLLIASVERHKQRGTVGLGLVSGFGLRQPGALASSVAHDAHNLIVAGTHAADMLLAIQHLQKTGGGFAVASQGEVRACLPLPFAGLLATEPAEVVIRDLQAVEKAAQGLGCDIPCHFGALSFLALPVIPEVKITDQGLFHVGEQRFLTY